jgi:hypothetical protein
MSISKQLLAACLTASVAIWATGCPNSAPTPTTPTKTGGDEHGHEHGAEGHDHAHDHGPHGGHVVEIGNEEFHAEWTHADDGTVTVYLLDAEMKNEVPIPAEDITIETKIGEKASTFKLAAVNRSEGDMPKTAKFEVVDKGLLGVLEALSEKVTATLKLDINGKPYEAAITHDDHGHKH